MLFMGPSQVSWILGVIQTHMLTPGSVWAYSPCNSGFFVLSPTYCVDQLVDPYVSYTKVDEASQHCWNGMAG
jgi:hypothetical protein